MNALGLLSEKLIGKDSQRSPRAQSMVHLPSGSSLSSGDGQRRSSSASSREKPTLIAGHEKARDRDPRESVDATSSDDEKTPFLSVHSDGQTSTWTSSSPSLPIRSIRAIIASLKWVIRTLTAPGVYVLSCFVDEQGRVSPLLPVRTLSRLLLGNKRSAKPQKLAGRGNNSQEQPKKRSKAMRLRQQDTASSTDSSVDDDPSQNSSYLRSHITGNGSGVENSTAEDGQRRSIRIKLYHAESSSSNQDGSPDPQNYLFPNVPRGSSPIVITPSILKSPIASSGPNRRSRFPLFPVPPHPLIPKLQPSNQLGSSLTGLARKTLVLDLDETLIHSMAKGGRMSTGHMVEVKLNSMTVPGGHLVGPQHPILYNVHKRPHCDEFLRRMASCYDLVVFTASVQEYADPVINWLEQERQYFSARYYRQHCTYRNGVYVKDITQVEPDLRRVMIIDNSPMSYVFHEENAVPIEGWINDPTDNDLLHLIPILEGLFCVVDVRAVLALRMGEASA